MVETIIETYYCCQYRKIDNNILFHMIYYCNILRNYTMLMLDGRKTRVTLIAIRVTEQWSAHNKLYTVATYNIFSIIVHVYW